MALFQKYLFDELGRGALLIMACLMAIALLTQAVSQLSLIVDSNLDIFRYAYVTILYMPQVISLAAPIAFFISTLFILDRKQVESEFVVMQTAGVTRLWLAVPVLRLATLIALVHLVVNLFIQPLAFRELRQELFAARADLAAALVKEGQFNSPVAGLTLYARRSSGAGQLESVIIDDRRDNNNRVTYVAERAVIGLVNDRPQISLRTGSVQEASRSGALQIVRFEQFLFDLAPFLENESEILYKATDRFLYELLTPDLGRFYERQNEDKLLAEGHARLSGPILSFALAGLALWALFGGQYSRRGYGRRIVIAIGLAAFLRVFTVLTQQIGEEAPALNLLQYVVPVGVAFVTLRGLDRRFVAGRPT